MPSFNRVTLIGNLTRDPETRDLPSGTTLCEFGLAMSRHYKTAGGDDREETCFIDCTAFGKQAEVLSQYVTKGRPLFVEGRLKYDQWDDKNGGGKRSKVSVIVEHFQFLGGRDENGSSPGGGRQSGLYDNAKSRRDGESGATADRNTDPAPADRGGTGAGRGGPRRRTKIDAIVDKEKRFADADIPF